MNSVPQDKDIFFMHRCLELASRGELWVAPNPMVGAILVYQDRIIGEGWHQQYGGPHAEVHCVNSVTPEDRSFISKSTLYVTLEPCNHHGKTPPCSDLIIREKIPNVVVGIVDPNPLVGGAGIEKLRKQRIDVKTGVAAQECFEINRKFFTSFQKKRPFITLKWAQSSDGFIAGKNGTPVKITGETTQRFTHRLRAQNMGIWVGCNTIINDNPLLDNRFWQGRNPQVIVSDPNDKLNPSARIFQSEKTPIVFNKMKGKGLLLEEFTLKNMFQILHQKGLQSVIVEGGAKTLSYFIEQNIWDEAIIYTGPTEIREGIKAPKFHGNIVKDFMLENDRIQIYRPNI